jgi:hypothetical protein
MTSLNSVVVDFHFLEYQLVCFNETLSEKAKVVRLRRCFALKTNSRQLISNIGGPLRNDISQAISYQRLLLAEANRTKTTNDTKEHPPPKEDGKNPEPKKPRRPSIPTRRMAASGPMTPIGAIRDGRTYIVPYFLQFGLFLGISTKTN